MISNLTSITRWSISAFVEITSTRRLSVNLALAILASIGATGVSIASDGSSPQGSALTKALFDQLKAQGVCKDNRSCNDALQMYREDGKRIYLNMYSQKDKKLASIVAEFLVARGLQITGGLPITLRVYPDPKTQYLGPVGNLAIIGVTPESIKLEINK